MLDAATAAAPSVRTARETATPDAFDASGLLLIPISPESRHERARLRLEDRDERLRRKSDDLAAAASAAGAAPRSSELATEAERQMKPGSASAAAHADREHSQRRAGQDRDPRQFRAALAESRAGHDKTSTPHASPHAAPVGGAEHAAPAGSARAATDAAGGADRAPATGSGSPPTAPRPDARAAPQLIRPASGAPIGAAAAETPRAAPSASAAAFSVFARAASDGAAAVSKHASVAPVRAAGDPLVAPGAGHAGSRTLGAAGAKGVERSAAAAQEPRSDDANIERIVRSLGAALRGARSVTTLRLDPPELGSLTLQLDLRAENLTLRIESQTAAAQRLLSDELDALRRGLESAGIRLERAEVTLVDAARPAPAEPPASPDPGAAGQHQPHADSRGANDQSEPQSAGGDGRQDAHGAGPGEEPATAGSDAAALSDLSAALDVWA